MSPVEDRLGGNSALANRVESERAEAQHAAGCAATPSDRATAFVNRRVSRVDRRVARKALQWEVSRRAIAVRDNLTPMTHVSVADILALPVQERIHLVEMIWESIAAFPEAIAVSPELKSELVARLADFERNPGAGYSWDQVKEQLKNGSWRTA